MSYQLSKYTGSREYRLCSTPDAGPTKIDVVGWEFTDEARVYAERVEELLAARPVANTVALTQLGQLRAGRRWSPEPMLFGWYRADVGVRGAVSMTPPYELLLAEVPLEAVEPLVSDLCGLGAELPGVHAEGTLAEAFASAWSRAAGASARTAMRQRLYQLRSPRATPSPPGRARRAERADLPLALDWYRGFQAETGGHTLDVEPQVRDRIEHGLLWLWEAGGRPVAFAARHPVTAGVVRVGPVYTPPAQRRHGYGQAVTEACTRDALDAGASSTVLFTDLANPTSNAIYQRIGYTPVADYRVIRFGCSYVGASGTTTP